MKKLLRNSAICTICRDEVESKHRTDMQICSCKSIWVDGGTELPYQGGRRGVGILDTSLWDIEDDRGWDD